MSLFFFSNLHRNHRLSIINIIDVDFPRQFYFSRYLMISVLERDRRAGLSCTSDGTNLPEPAKFDSILDAICRRIVITKFFSCICISCIAITHLSKYVPIQFDRFQLESICENPTFCRTICSRSWSVIERHQALRKFNFLTIILYISTVRTGR